MKSSGSSKTFPADFPSTAAQWEEVIARSPGDDRPLTPDEETRWNTAVLVDGGGYQAARAVVAQRRKPGQRGRQHSPTKQLVSVRYSPEVLAYFKSQGAGWQTRMDEALKQWVSVHGRKSSSSTET